MARGGRPGTPRTAILVLGWAGRLRTLEGLLEPPAARWALATGALEGLLFRLSRRDPPPAASSHLRVQDSRLGRPEGLRRGEGGGCRRHRTV